MILASGGVGRAPVTVGGAREDNDGGHHDESFVFSIRCVFFCVSLIFFWWIFDENLVANM